MKVPQTMHSKQVNRTFGSVLMNPQDRRQNGKQAFEASHALSLPVWVGCVSFPSPWPSPAGRGNTAPRAATSRGALDWRKLGGRFSLLYVFFHLPCSAESRTGRWGRHTPCRGCGAGAGALVALWNRQHAFVGEPEPLMPCVRNSNR